MPETGRRNMKNVAPATIILILYLLASCQDPDNSGAYHYSQFFRGVELPAQNVDQASLTVMALGDTGTGESGQIDVAEALHDYDVANGSDFVLLLGDNFYDHGVESVDDDLLQERFEDVYLLDVPFYAIMGNHDHKGAPEAQIAYSQISPHWVMPDAFYSVQYILNDGTVVHLIALDTETLEEDETISDHQIEWLTDILSQSNGDWKIVFGHHPLYSEGAHGGSSKLVSLLEALFVEYGIHLYLAGHEHDQAILIAPWDGYALVSGAGSKSRDTGIGDDTVFAIGELGFMVLRIDSAAIWIDVLNADGDAEYSLEVTAD